MGKTIHRMEKPDNGLKKRPINPQMDPKTRTNNRRPERHASKHFATSVLREEGEIKVFHVNENVALMSSIAFYH